MLTPNQISTHKFFQTKQGYYKADDVDDYMGLVFQTVYDLYETNKKIQIRLNGLTKDLETYYKDKDSIAAALIVAETFASEKKESAEKSANEILSEAEKKAELIIDEKKGEADDYYNAKKKEADELISKAETILQESKDIAAKNAEEYIAKINAQASEIITKANEQASNIVSRAFGDAKKAKDKYDEIISNANLTLPSINREVSSLKINLTETLNGILEAISSIEVPDEILIETNAINEDDFTYEPVSLPKPLKADEVTDVKEDSEAEDFIEPIEENSEQALEVEATTQEDSTDIFSSSQNADSFLKQKFNFDDLFYDNSEENSED